MGGKNQQLTASRELSYVNQKDSLLGSLLRKVINAVNTTAVNAAVSSIGKLSPPPPIDSITPAGTYTPKNTFECSGEILHYTLTHNQAIQKGIQYLSEVDTNPNFTQPHVIDHGCSRSAFVSLPTFMSDGVTPQTYYLRSYAQYHGSDASPKTVFGGINGAIPITMGGTSAATLQPSQGSGTARNGQQGGVGLGTILNRPAPGPKRNLL